jgi:hypothetical protein
MFEYHLEGIWKDVVVAYLKAVCKNLAGDTEEYHERRQSE